MANWKQQKLKRRPGPQVTWAMPGHHQATLKPQSLRLYPSNPLKMLLYSIVIMYFYIFFGYKRRV